MNFKKISRKTHRYMGLIIGIQFLFWTLGGLYFSWTNIEEIRGNTLKKSDSFFSKDLQITDINIHIDSLKQAGILDSIKNIELTQLLDQPHMLITYFTLKNKKVSEERLLIDLRTNSAINEIAAKLATKIAQNSLIKPVEVSSTKLLLEEDVNNHHEFRGGVFPAYAVQFNTKNKLVIYIDAKSGELLNYRTQNWRIFDFLWMMHTMDYAGRDNLNNWILRTFSVLGLITIFSGFILYMNSSRMFRKKKLV
ncbi:MAG: PepSY domain-containing protein [Bacteroidales bacterium]|nr:PepSY domain-containing protein [Bacteroidales bacterium]